MRTFHRVTVLAGAAAFFLGCSSGEKNNAAPVSREPIKTGSSSMSLRISSTAFSDQGRIPSKYTCEGDDLSPPLEWSGAPDGTQSFALIVDDPDAPDPAKPQRVYVHWVVYNIPPDATGFDENAWKGKLPPGTMTGTNDWKKQGWGGPCPPIGRHRYFFKLYALDTTLTGLSSPSKKEVEEAMKGHIIAQAQLVGTYQKGD